MSDNDSNVGETVEQAKKAAAEKAAEVQTKVDAAVDDVSDAAEHGVDAAATSTAAGVEDASEAAEEGVEAAQKVAHETIDKLAEHVGSVDSDAAHSRVEDIASTAKDVLAQGAVAGRQAAEVAQETATRAIGTAQDAYRADPIRAIAVAGAAVLALVGLIVVVVRKK